MSRLNLATKMEAKMNKFDTQWIDSIVVSLNAANCRVQRLMESRPTTALTKEFQVALLLKAITCLDLTTLSGDDTCGNVQMLCYKGCQPIPQKLVSILDLKTKIKVAAICVYPSLIQDCVVALQKYDSESLIKIASVAAGFPSGQYPLESRVLEIKHAVVNGANEIDVVINRKLVLANDFKTLYDELVTMRKACSTALMKTIVAAGELGTLSNVYKASLVAMMAGTDFIKTSTGKETVNATLLIGLVMTRAINSFYLKTGRKVGFKPAGGIRTAHDVLRWQILIKEELGNDWLQPSLFRIGASALLDDINRNLFELIFGRKAFAIDLPTVDMLPE